MTSGRRKPVFRKRKLAREYTLQALYQHLLTGTPVDELCGQFVPILGTSGADEHYFQEIIQYTVDKGDELRLRIEPCLNRSCSNLDPVEHAVILIALYELLNRVDIPFRVVLNEAIDLEKKFGHPKGHTYVNGVLDCLARKYRRGEIGLRSGGHGGGKEDEPQ